MSAGLTFTPTSVPGSLCLGFPHARKERLLKPFHTNLQHCRITEEPRGEHAPGAAPARRQDLNDALADARNRILTIGQAFGLALAEWRIRLAVFCNNRDFIEV